ncbi:MAG: hypothetical protein ACK5KL_05260 [Dysgonomonas sp.]
MKFKLWNLILFIFFFGHTGCSSQQSNDKNSEKINDTLNISKSKNDNMERFNIGEFDDNRHYNDYSFITPEGVTVFQCKVEDGYIEEWQYSNGYINIKYFYPDGALKIKGYRFHNLDCGVWKYYDEQGNVIKDVNWNASFKFSVEDLINMMKRSEDIDLLDGKSLFSIERYEKNNIHKSLYAIWINSIENANMVDCFMIDGDNGDILFKRSRYKIGKNGSFLDEYLNEDK